MKRRVINAATIITTLVLLVTPHFATAEDCPSTQPPSPFTVSFYLENCPISTFQPNTEIRSMRENGMYNTYFDKLTLTEPRFTFQTTMLLPVIWFTLKNSIIYNIGASALLDVPYTAGAGSIIIITNNTIVGLDQVSVPCFSLAAAMKDTLTIEITHNRFEFSPSGPAIVGVFEVFSISAGMIRANSTINVSYNTITGNAPEVPGPVEFRLLQIDVVLKENTSIIVQGNVVDMSGLACSNGVPECVVDSATEYSTSSTILKSSVVSTTGTNLYLNERSSFIVVDNNVVWRSTSPRRFVKLRVVDIQSDFAIKGEFIVNNNAIVIDNMLAPVITSHSRILNTIAYLIINGPSATSITNNTMTYENAAANTITTIRDYIIKIGQALNITSSLASLTISGNVFVRSNATLKGGPNSGEKWASGILFIDGVVASHIYPSSKLLISNNSMILNIKYFRETGASSLSSTKVFIVGITGPLLVDNGALVEVHGNIIVASEVFLGGSLDGVSFALGGSTTPIQSSYTITTLSDGMLLGEDSHLTITHNTATLHNISDIGFVQFYAFSTHIDEAMNLQLKSGSHLEVSNNKVDAIVLRCSTVNSEIKIVDIFKFGTPAPEVGMFTARISFSNNTILSYIGNSSQFKAVIFEDRSILWQVTNASKISLDGNTIIMKCIATLGINAAIWSPNKLEWNMNASSMSVQDNIVHVTGSPPPTPPPIFGGGGGGYYLEKVDSTIQSYFITNYNIKYFTAMVDIIRASSTVVYLNDASSLQINGNDVSFISPDYPYPGVSSSVLILLTTSNIMPAENSTISISHNVAGHVVTYLCRVWSEVSVSILRTSIGPQPYPILRTGSMFEFRNNSISLDVRDDVEVATPFSGMACGGEGSASLNVFNALLALMSLSIDGEGSKCTFSGNNLTANFNGRSLLRSHIIAFQIVTSAVKLTNLSGTIIEVSYNYITSTTDWDLAMFNASNISVIYNQSVRSPCSLSYPGTISVYMDGSKFVNETTELPIVVVEANVVQLVIVREIWGSCNVLTTTFERFPGRSLLADISKNEVTLKVKSSTSLDEYGVRGIVVAGGIENRILGSASGLPPLLNHAIIQGNAFTILHSTSSTIESSASYLYNYSYNEAGYQRIQPVLISIDFTEAGGFKLWGCTNVIQVGEDDGSSSPPLPVIEIIDDRERAKRWLLFPGPAKTILSHCDTQTITMTPSSSPPSTTHSSSHFDNSTSVSLTHPSATFSAATTTLSRGKVSLSNSSTVGTKTLSRTAHTPSQSPSSSHLSSPTLATITPSAVSHSSSRSGSAPTITPTPPTPSQTSTLSHPSQTQSNTPQYQCDALVITLARSHLTASQGTGQLLLPPPSSSSSATNNTTPCVTPTGSISRGYNLPLQYLWFAHLTNTTTTTTTNNDVVVGSMLDSITTLHQILLLHAQEGGGGVGYDTHCSSPPIIKIPYNRWAPSSSSSTGTLLFQLSGPSDSSIIVLPSSYEDIWAYQQQMQSPSRRNTLQGAIIIQAWSIFQSSSSSTPSNDNAIADPSSIIHIVISDGGGGNTTTGSVGSGANSLSLGVSYTGKTRLSGISLLIKIPANLVLVCVGEGNMLTVRIHLSPPTPAGIPQELVDGVGATTTIASGLTGSPGGVVRGGMLSSLSGLLRCEPPDLVAELPLLSNPFGLSFGAEEGQYHRGGIVSGLILLTILSTFICGLTIPSSLLAMRGEHKAHVTAYQNDQQQLQDTVSAAASTSNQPTTTTIIAAPPPAPTIYDAIAHTYLPGLFLVPMAITGESWVPNAATLMSMPNASGGDIALGVCVTLMYASYIIHIMFVTLRTKSVTVRTYIEEKRTTASREPKWRRVAMYWLRCPVVLIPSGLDGDGNGTEEEGGEWKNPTRQQYAHLMSYSSLKQMRNGGDGPLLKTNLRWYLRFAPYADELHILWFKTIELAIGSMVNFVDGFVTDSCLIRAMILLLAIACVLCILVVKRPLAVVAQQFTTIGVYGSMLVATVVVVANLFIQHLSLENVAGVLIIVSSSFTLLQAVTDILISVVAAQELLRHVINKRRFLASALSINRGLTQQQKHKSSGIINQQPSHPTSSSSSSVSHHCALDVPMIECSGTPPPMPIKTKLEEKGNTMDKNHNDDDCESLEMSEASTSTGVDGDHFKNEKQNQLSEREIRDQILAELEELDLHQSTTGTSIKKQQQQKKQGRRSKKWSDL